MRRPSGNQLVFLGHVAVAAFVALFRYPPTQDGPAHLYTVHVLRALFHDPSSVYHRYFTPSIHPGSNGLFFYLGVWAGDFMPLERVTSAVFFAALVLLPLSSLSFTRALHATLPEDSPLPAVSAWALACPLAYSYFLYRGLFNFCLGISFSFFTLAAVVMQSAPLRARTRVLLGVLALVAAALAAFAHASAIAFLFFAIPVACVPFRSRVAPARIAMGAMVWILLLLSSQTSHVSNDGPLGPRWWTPWTSLVMLVRAFGVTQSYLEVLPALALLIVVSATFVRLLPELRFLRERYASLWPVALAMAVGGGYFVVPNVVSEISGVNERLPLFAAMLLIPFVPAAGRVARVLAWAAIPFGLYVAVIDARLESRVRTLLRAGDGVPMERGAIVFPATLNLKLGSVSANLGRYLVADIARRHDAVTGNLFYGHPVFPVQGTAETPSVPDPTPVQAFAHLSPQEREAALANPRSPIQLYFAESRQKARGARYIVVIPFPPLDDAFRDHVLVPLGARPAIGSTPILPVFEVPATTIPDVRGIDAADGRA